MHIKSKTVINTAFTLAEILITLGVIGVIATMTIPTLMKDIQDTQFKTAYKKAYSVASQAWLMAYNNGNLALCTQVDSLGGTCNHDNFIAFKNQMKVAKDCGTDTASCWNMSGEKSFQNASPTTDALAFIDNSGTAWAQVNSTPDSEVLIDTNSNKPPNKYGRDRSIISLYYYSTAIPSLNLQANTPITFLYADFPNPDTTTWPNNEQLYRCPSMATHPCYYKSWITDGH